MQRNPSVQTFQERFQSLLGSVPAAPEHTNAHVTETVDAGDHVRQKVVILPDSEDPIPVWLLIPKTDARSLPAMLCLHATTKGSGRMSQRESRVPCQAVRRSKAVPTPCTWCAGVM